MWWFITAVVAFVIGLGGYFSMKKEGHASAECAKATAIVAVLIFIVSGVLSLFFTGDKTTDTPHTASDIAQVDDSVPTPEVPTFFMGATGLLHNINISVADLKLPTLKKSATSTPENTQFDPNPQVSIVFSHPQGAPDKVNSVVMVFQGDGTIKSAFYPLAVIAGLTPYLMPKERGEILESLMKKDDHGKIKGSWADDYMEMSLQQTDFGALFVATPK